MKTLLQQKLRDIIARGYTTTEEIFVLNYPEWPPQGLDTTHYKPLTHKIKVTSLFAVWRDPEKSFVHNLISNLFVHGRCAIDNNGSPIIGLPLSVRFRACGHLILGHEGVHASQVLLNKIDYLYWQQYFLSRQGNVPDRSDFYESREVLKALYMVDRSEMIAQTLNLKGSPSLIGQLILKVIGQERINSFCQSFGSGKEIQARLHTILVQHYADWKRIPATKTELWAALRQAGITTPAKICSYLENKKEGKNAAKNFETGLICRSKDRFSDASYINHVYKRIQTPKGQELFWEVALPLLYGQLLEIYGDPNGRVKMGFTPKEKGLALNLSAMEIQKQKPISEKYVRPGSGTQISRHSLGEGGWKNP